MLKHLKTSIQIKQIKSSGAALHSIKNNHFPTRKKSLKSNRNFQTKENHARSRDESREKSHGILFLGQGRVFRFGEGVPHFVINLKQEEGQGKTTQNIDQVMMMGIHGRPRD